MEKLSNPTRNGSATTATWVSIATGLVYNEKILMALF
jgi:hypothetical protein